MREPVGYIRIHRKIAKWEWWDDPNTAHLFLHLLISANKTTGRWRGLEIKAGQLVTTLRRLSSESGLSVRSVRTALNHLISTHELTQEATHDFHLVTIVNWALYQYCDSEPTQEPTQEVTNDRQTTDKRPTNDRHLSNKKIKKLNEEKDKKDTVVYGKFQNVHMTEEEYREVGDKDLVEQLSAYKEQTGKKYKNDYAALLNWKRRREKEPRGAKNIGNFQQREYPDEYYDNLFAKIEGEDK